MTYVYAWGYRGMKTEHSGAKNGGGFWGPRAEAKTASKKRRRRKSVWRKYEEAA
jgi:hypothetical protein